MSPLLSFLEYYGADTEYLLADLWLTGRLHVPSGVLFSPEDDTCRILDV